MQFIKERPNSAETLELVLRQREIKSNEIKVLSEHYHAPVIGIRVNIPGESKREAWAFKLFRAAVEAVTGKLNQSGIVYFSKILEPHYEYLMLIVAKEEIAKLKQICVEIEESHPMGRTFDLDVYLPDATPISRGEGSQRKCFLCDAPAHECARSRAHDVASLRAYLISKASSL